jgi:hypothetical protein
MSVMFIKPVPPSEMTEKVSPLTVFALSIAKAGRKVDAFVAVPVRL